MNFTLVNSSNKAGFTQLKWHFSLHFKREQMTAQVQYNLSADLSRIEDKFQALEKPQKPNFQNAKTSRHITCLLGASFAHL